MSFYVRQTKKHKSCLWPSEIASLAGFRMNMPLDMGAPVPMIYGRCWAGEKRLDQHQFPPATRMKYYHVATPNKGPCSHDF